MPGEHRLANAQAEGSEIDSIEFIDQLIEFIMWACLVCPTAGLIPDPNTSSNRGAASQKKLFVAFGHGNVQRFFGTRCSRIGCTEQF